LIEAAACGTLFARNPLALERFVHIDDDHQHHGAALLQIVEHRRRRSTAIRPFEINRDAVRGAYVIDRKIGIFLKYATKPVRKDRRSKEFQFQFKTEHGKALEHMRRRVSSLFIGLICVDARNVCVVTYDDFEDILGAWREMAGTRKRFPTFSLLALLEAGKQFRVYAPMPKARGGLVGEKTVPRRDFPSILFR
jgi:hypothetical protein